MTRDQSFEVQVCQQGRWLTRETFPREAEAKALATSLLSNGALEGVKILKIRQRGDAESETIVFSEMRETVVNERIQVVSIDQASWCDRLEDCYLPPARATVGRVLRQYLDKLVITPIEMMHSHREMKRIADFENLMPSAIGRVTTLQARDNPAGGDAKARANMIYDWAGKITEAGRKVAETPNLPKLETDSLDNCLMKIEKALPPDRAGHASLVVLCQATITTRSWLGKVEQLLTILETATHPSAAKLIDPIIADSFASNDAIRDLLGRQLNLASAIITLVDLARGHMKVALKGDEEFIGQLNRHFATTGLLPESKEAILEGIRRQLRGRGPMTHGEVGQQKEAYRKVVLHLMGTKGSVLGGPTMADAIVLGNARFIDEGGETGRKLAISTIASVMEAQADKARIILVALQGTISAELSEPLIRQAMDILRRGQKFTDLTKPDQPPPERLRSVAQLQSALIASQIIPEPNRSAYIEKLDTLLAEFLSESGILAKLDDHGHSLRLRALRLVQFAASGVLTQGKAKAMVRDLVNAHVGRADFRTAFVADMPDASQHASALADFSAQLARADLG
jgi:hypothetical protein